MKVIYGKESTRIDLTPAVKDISWSSSRGQMAQTCELYIHDPPVLEAAGFLMVFTGQLNEAEQIFHGPIVRFQRDEMTGGLQATAYELSWYFQKNETSRILVKGDAGKELERIIRATGISFSAPSFGFQVNERISAQSYANLYTTLTEKAWEQTGVRYFLQHRRDKLSVIPEGGNSQIPLFRAGMLSASSSGESIEELYTVVKVERYAGDKVASSVTKEHGELIKKMGRMQKVIDAGEEKNLGILASSQLSKLSKLTKTRSITVMHENHLAAFLRSGWAIKIMEKDGKTITDWIVNSCRTRWKQDQYTMDLELERRG